MKKNIYKLNIILLFLIDLFFKKLWIILIIEFNELSKFLNGVELLLIDY